MDDMRLAERPGPSTHDRTLVPFEAAVARAILTGLMAIAFVILLRTAWASDDALITVRCILNALHGYGPVFNIDERVQAFTHPLWFLCATAATTLVGNPWMALLALSAAASLSSLWLIFSRLGNGGWAGLLACIIVLLSKAYEDYSTSGLETPLTTLLILAVLASGFRRLAGGRQARISLCPFYFGLLYLNRADVVLLLAPFMLVVLCRVFRGRRALLFSLGAAALPVAGWTVFSLLYYGLLVPNTAFAKLGGAIPHHERWLQGAVYLFDSLGRDAVTLPAVALGVFLGMRRGLAGMALSAGTVIYLLYVVWIGGDQMSGRFFVAPLAVFAALAAQTRWLDVQGAVGAGCLLLLGAINLPATLMSDPQMPVANVADTGIADERAIFFHAFGLVRVTRTNLRTPPWPDHLAHIASVKVIECGGLGVTGIMNGPGVHVIDQCALADPLLSHLPAAPNDGWRISHLVRDMPAGYRASVLSDANRITDPTVARLYDSVRLVTRGPIFSRARLAAILRMNFRH